MTVSSVAADKQSIMAIANNVQCTAINLTPNAATDVLLTATEVRLTWKLPAADAAAAAFAAIAAIAAMLLWSYPYAPHAAISTVHSPPQRGVLPPCHKPLHSGRTRATM
jgi:hypothetical protein